MDSSKMKNEGYFNKLNPIVLEGIKREFKKLDVSEVDFEDKVENLIKQLLEMEFKEVVNEWKKEDSTRPLPDSKVRISRTKIFEEILEELIAQLEVSILEETGENEFARSKIGNIKSKYQKVLRRDAYSIKQLVKKIDKNIYVDYLKYRILSNRQKLNKEKNKLEERQEELQRIKAAKIDGENKLLVIEKEIKKYQELKEKQVLGEEDESFDRIIDELQQQKKNIVKLIELTIKQKQNIEECIRISEILYKCYVIDIDSEEKRNKEEIALIEGEYTEDIPQIDEDLVDLEETEEFIEISGEGKDNQDENFAEEETEESIIEEEQLEKNPFFSQVEDIMQKINQSDNLDDYIKLCTQLADDYMKIGDEEERVKFQEIIRLFSRTFPPAELGLGLIQIATRKRYMELTGEENLTDVERKDIEYKKNLYIQMRDYLQEIFPDENVSTKFPPLKTEKEYVEELKNIELEMIKTERNIETQRHFIFGKKRSGIEDEGKEDITEKMMQMYSELSQVVDVTKTNDIQRTYNRIIRKLKRMSNIDISMLPPALKEMVVQRVETPLPNTRNGDTNSESRKIQKTGANVGEEGPLME